MVTAFGDLASAAASPCTSVVVTTEKVTGLGPGACAAGAVGGGLGYEEEAGEEDGLLLDGAVLDLLHGIIMMRYNKMRYDTI